MAALGITRTFARRLALPGAASTRLHAKASTPACAHPYSSYSTVHENDPDKLHEHKHSSLAAQKEGKGQWREELASDAEAFIKAEREEIKASGEEIERLQKETNKLLKQTGVKS
ncbi:hypothetical protein Dda_2368 [Drechslerella dactyloides]|uniref:Mitochondrial ATPase inhibitor n=1 Tax=Drechslerella dactyloides TaxID=74499 RepID=A0AAD6J495_DREDA|nr:hypothetical protein Dda_2368 [Drechslerella dactyloides]